MVKHKKKKAHQTHDTKEEIKPAKDNTWLWAVTIIIVVAIVGAAYVLTSNNDDTPINVDFDDPGELEGMEKVKVDFYVMSQCPYGTQVEDAIAPVLEAMGENIDFNLNFIATDNGDGTFRSLHGQPEVDGNIVQLCAEKYNPDKYMAMIVCQNTNARAIPDNWEACATENGLDVQNIKTCYEGAEGQELHRENIKLAQQVGATGSPTIFFNDVKYSGGRSINDFTRAICNALESDKPQECDKIPECTTDADCPDSTGQVGKCENPGTIEANCVLIDPVKVNVITISDKRCVECDITGLMGQLKGIFPGLEVTSYDYSDADGKALFDDLELGLLPAILFDSSVQEDNGFATVQQYLVPKGDYLSLRVGAKFDPAAEVCTNEIDDTGNGLIDCDDPTCSDTLECREEMEQQLQVFVMSDCPYGKLAIKALKELEDNFGDNLDYEVHYIANEDGDGFRSLHGQYEVDENIIQLCVLEHSPDVWMDYTYCRSDKGIKGIDWKICAEETDVDVSAVESCFDGDEGADLLRDDIKIANALGIGASPTWLANNRYQFGGIDAETVKTQFCTYNPDAEGCENTLSGKTASTPSGTC